MWYHNGMDEQLAVKLNSPVSTMLAALSAASMRFGQPSYVDLSARLNDVSIGFFDEATYIRWKCALSPEGIEDNWKDALSSDGIKDKSDFLVARECRLIYAGEDKWTITIRYSG